MRIEALKPVEHAYKRMLFGALKPLLKRGDGSEGQIDTSKLRRVLFLRPERLGDLVISLPVFDGLKKHFPQIEIGLVASPRNIALVEHDPRFFRRYLYQKSFFSNLSLMKSLRSDHYDAVVDMICDDSVTALLMAQLGAPGKPRIGVGKVLHRPYYDRAFDYRLNNTGHVIPNTLQLLRAFGIDDRAVSGYAEPYLGPEIIAKADEWWTEQVAKQVGSDTIVLGLNLSAGAPNRIWPTTSYATLMTRLRSMRNYHFVLFAIGEDRRLAELLEREFASIVSVLPADFSILGASAIIRRLHTLISPDTSLIHIARSFRVPVVGLYNQAQKNFTLWRPFDQVTGALVSNSAASILSISPDDVINALLAQQLETRKVSL